ncbi:hypothetical protein GCM10027275_44550 [Rhabdobacter roseus]
MTRFSPFLFSLFVFLASTGTARADLVQVKITFETRVEPRTVHVELDNGSGPLPTQVRVEKDTFFVSGFSDVAYTGLVIRLAAKGQPTCVHRFWVGKGPAEIHFLAKSNSEITCPLADFKLTNVIDVQYHDQQWAAFISREVAVLDSISSSLQARFEGGDTLAYQSEEAHNAIGAAKKQIFTRKLRYFQEHPDEYSFARFREVLFGIEGTLEPSIIQVFESFPLRFRQSPEGQEVLRTITGKLQREGSMALDFTAVDIHGTPLHLADFKGKHVLMVFWATWCGPCQEEIPVLRRLHDAYEASDLVIISFAKDDKLEKVKDHVAAKGMDWFQVVNDDALLREYGVWGVPKTVLIDPTGKIAIIDQGSNITRVVGYLKEKIAR